MQLDVYDDFNAIPLTREHWNALSSRSATHTIFQTHEWASAWWKTFGDRHRFLCLAITEGTQTVALAPLMSGPATGKDWHFVADANSDYCDFAAEGNRYAALDRLLRFFARDFGDWNRLTLRNIPEQSTTLASLATLCEKYGLYLKLGARIAAPKVRLDDAQGYAFKYSVRRHCNRLERLGTVEFRLAQDAQELPGMLDLLYRQHIARYREKGERSLFEEPRCRKFYEVLAYELLGTGWLHFSQLLLNGTPLAVHYGFEHNGILTWYKPAFDIGYGHFSPGTVLIRNLIDYAQQRRLQVVDFTIGDEEFKSRFSNAMAYNRSVIVFKDRRSAYLHGLTDRAIGVGKRTFSALARPHVSSKRRHPDP